MWLFRKNADPQVWDELNHEVLKLTGECRSDEALDAGKKLFRYSRKTYGKWHENTATALNNLGTICTTRNQFDEAESYLLAALQIAERVRGKLSKEVLVVNMNLAKLYTAKARWINEAIGAYRPETTTKH